MTGGIGGFNMHTAVGLINWLGANTRNKENEMPVGITQLVASIGDENIKLQSLDKCATDFKKLKDGGTQIKFETDQPFGLDGTNDIGIVLWLPREKVKAILGT